MFKIKFCPICKIKIPWGSKEATTFNDGTYCPKCSDFKRKQLREAYSKGTQEEVPNAFPPSS